MRCGIAQGTILMENIKNKTKQNSNQRRTTDDYLIAPPNITVSFLLSSPLLVTRLFHVPICAFFSFGSVPSSTVPPFPNPFIALSHLDHKLLPIVLLLLNNQKSKIPPISTLADVLHPSTLYIMTRNAFVPVQAVRCISLPSYPLLSRSQDYLIRCLPRAIYSLGGETCRI